MGCCRIPQPNHTIPSHERNSMDVEQSTSTSGLQSTNSKRCTLCNRVLPTTAFDPSTKRSNGKRYLRSWCRSCMYEKTKSYHTRQIKLDRHGRRICHNTYAKAKRVYGLTRESYDILINSSVTCHICGKGFVRPEPCIDHCHRTRRVRGLLCRTCNLFLGRIGDNPEILRRAIAYLEAPRLRLVRLRPRSRPGPQSRTGRTPITAGGGHPVVDSLPDYTIESIKMTHAPPTSGS